MVLTLPSRNLFVDKQFWLGSQAWIDSKTRRRIIKTWRWKFWGKKNWLTSICTYITLNLGDIQDFCLGDEYYLGGVFFQKLFRISFGVGFYTNTKVPVQKFLISIFYFLTIRTIFFFLERGWAQARHLDTVLVLRTVLKWI